MVQSDDLGTQGEKIQRKSPCSAAGIEDAFSGLRLEKIQQEIAFHLFDYLPDGSGEPPVVGIRPIIEKLL